MPTTRQRDNSFLNLPVTYPKTVLFCFLAAGLVLAFFAQRFEINASAETLLTEDNQHYLRAQVVQRRFNPQEFLLVAYEPQGHSLFSERTYADLRALSQRLETLDRVTTVTSILNVPLLSLAPGELSPDLDPEEWTLEKVNPTPEALAELFSGHPIYEDLLVNEAQTATALQISFERNESLERLRDQIVAIQSRSLYEERELTEEEEAEIERLKQEAEPHEQALQEQRNEEVEQIRGMLAEFGQDSRTYLGGAHALAYQLINIIQNDLAVFGAAICAMICVLLLLLFRAFRWMLIPLICCVFSVVATVGLFAIADLKATVISANFIALQLILTLAIVIHLIVQYREELSAAPSATGPELMRSTLRAKAAPCFYAAITTSVGFASLYFSGIQPVKIFGLMMIIAMFVSTAASLVLFPALVGVFGKGKPSSESRLAHGVLAACVYLAHKRKALIAIPAVLITVAGAFGLARLDVENSFINYFRESTQIHQELHFIDQEFGGSTPLDIIYDLPLPDDDPTLIISADSVQWLQAIQSAVVPLEGVGKVLSLVNFTQLGKALNGGRPLTEYELTALYYAVDKSLRDELIGSYLSVEDDQARISIRIQDATEGLNRADLLASIHESIQSLGVTEDEYFLSNLFVLYQDILQRLFRSQITTISIVFVALLICFLLIFRSIKIALIAIVPNIIATVLILGLMGWIGMPLDLMTITIAAVAMGIAVDDTIHYIDRYRSIAKEGASHKLCVQRTHNSVGYAILFTSIIIVLGFSLLGFSDFVPSVQFGLLTALSIFLALITDLTLLPIMLAWTNRKREAEPAPPPSSPANR